MKYNDITVSIYVLVKGSLLNSILLDEKLLLVS